MNKLIINKSCDLRYIDYETDIIEITGDGIEVIIDGIRNIKNIVIKNIVNSRIKIACATAVDFYVENTKQCSINVEYSLIKDLTIYNSDIYNSFSSVTIYNLIINSSNITKSFHYCNIKNIDINLCLEIKESFNNLRLNTVSIKNLLLLINSFYSIEALNIDMIYKIGTEFSIINSFNNSKNRHKVSIIAFKKIKNLIISNSFNGNLEIDNSKLVSKLSVLKSFIGNIIKFNNDIKLLVVTKENKFILNGVCDVIEFNGEINSLSDIILNIKTVNVSNVRLYDVKCDYIDFNTFKKLEDIKLTNSEIKEIYTQQNCEISIRNLKAEFLLVEREGLLEVNGNNKIGVLYYLSNKKLPNCIDELDNIFIPRNSKIDIYGYNNRFYYADNLDEIKNLIYNKYENRTIINKLKLLDIVSSDSDIKNIEDTVLCIKSIKKVDSVIRFCNKADEFKKYIKEDKNNNIIISTINYFVTYGEVGYKENYSYEKSYNFNRLCIKFKYGNKRISMDIHIDNEFKVNYKIRASIYNNFYYKLLNQYDEYINIRENNIFDYKVCKIDNQTLVKYSEIIDSTMLKIRETEYICLQTYRRIKLYNNKIHIKSIKNLM